MKKLFVSMLLLLGIGATMLTGCGNTSNRVVIYTAAEEERIEYLQKEMNAKFPQYEIVFQSIGTGALVSKLQAEGKSTECDIFYDLEATNAEIILNGNSDLFYDLSEYDFSIYDSSVTEYTKNHHKYAVNGKTVGTIVVNKKVLQQNGCDVPATYDDLLKPEYKGLITMPSPKSSGTGYAFYNGLVSSMGESAALSYFGSLDANIKEYTTSGSAPIKAVNKGEVAIGVGLLWQCVDYANKNSDLEVVFLNNEASYNLFTMGIISGKEKKESVKNVFDYLYNELNKVQCEKFNPDKIYVNQGKAEIANYPTGFSEIVMHGVFDFKYKQDLLDKWSWS
ncbi:MAG TPA: extracellular solute-binding protein [Fervidobacterium sp.]|jgi:iron(III) transport system substrate-binding protein|nr:extracellular solute-binding protein [Fervidobacterium sp.]